MAAGRKRCAAQTHDAGAVANNGAARVGSLAGRRARGLCPHPLRRPVQALGAALLRTGDETPCATRDRPRPAHSAHPRRPARPRRPLARNEPRPLHNPKHNHALARDLPAGLEPRRSRPQPDQRHRTPRRARHTRTDRHARAGSRVDRSRTRQRPSLVGHRLLRRAATRRTDGTQVGGHRPRRRPHPRRVVVGHAGWTDRAEEPRWQTLGADRQRAARAPRRTRPPRRTTVRVGVRPGPPSDHSNPPRSAGEPQPPGNG